MDTIEKLFARADKLAESARWYYRYRAERAIEDTQSPIEALVYFELMLWGGESEMKPIITPQARIGKYRVDFLIECNGKKVVIECDGHDYHERTKEQAAHDKKRDRYLMDKGYHVRHYTGSEIYKDAREIVHELEILIDDELREMLKRDGLLDA